MNLTYAIADLHGADDLLELALTAIEKHAAAAPAGSCAVVFLGDYVDRGPGSRQIIERLMAGPAEGWRWMCLKGNHEDMLVDTIRTPLDPDWWIGNGGGATLESYDATYASRGQRAIPEAHIAWMEALPPLAADHFRVYVHAGVDPTLPLEEQVTHELLWSRMSNRHGHDGRFIVHGHTPHKKGPITEGQSIDLDTLAWKTGRLVIGVFDDGRPGGPIDLIEVLRAAGDNLAA